MPVYSHLCETCHKTHDFYRPMSRASDIERCPDCKSETSRIYSFGKEKEFFEYEDAEYGASIHSKRQERQLMKAHGHVDFRETPAYSKDRWKQCRSVARRKPSYFIPGVQRVYRDRD